MVDDSDDPVDLLPLLLHLAILSSVRIAAGGRMLGGFGTWAGLVGLIDTGE